MEWKDELFAVKVHELQDKSELFLSGMELLGSQNIEMMKDAVKRLQGEEQLELQSFRRMAKEAKSAVVSRLASLQIDYMDQMQSVLSEELKRPLYSNDMASETERNTEMMALFTEYMIDAANWMMRHAYLSALNTIILDMESYTSATHRK